MPYLLRATRPPTFYCIEQLDEWVGDVHGTVGVPTKGKVRKHRDAATAATAVTRALAAYTVGYHPAEPTDPIRFVLASPDRKLFAWFELRGASVVHASGPMKQVATTEPAVLEHASAEDARADRDQRARDLLRAGYTVKALETGPVLSPPAAISTATRSAIAPFLERIRARPDDDDAWHELGDWLLANDPEAAILVERERAGAVIDHAVINAPALIKRLSGLDTRLVTGSLVDSTWKSAHLVHGRLSTARRGGVIDEPALFAACGAAPAFAVVQSLDIELTYVSALASLAGFPWLRALRLASRNESSFDRAPLPADWLARFPALHALTLRNVELHPDDALPAHLASISLEVPWPTSVLALRWPGVTSLQIDLRPNPTALTAALLDGLAAHAPSLTSLHVITPVAGPDTDEPGRFLDALERSPVLPRLRRVIVDTREQRVVVPPDVRASFRGGTLAHLDHLELGERYLRTR